MARANDEHDVIIYLLLSDVMYQQDRWLESTLRRNWSMCLVPHDVCELAYARLTTR